MFLGLLDLIILFLCTVYGVGKVVMCVATFVESLFSGGFVSNFKKRI